MVPAQHQSSKGNNRPSHHRGVRRTEAFLGEESPKTVCWIESVPRGQTYKKLNLQVNHDGLLVYPKSLG